MEKSKIEILNKLVKKEARKLRRYATQKELSNLDFSDFDPMSRNDCIYGQMCKSCYSNRANELIIKCAERVYTQPKKCNLPLSKNRINNLNGKPKLVENRAINYHSPIELFVVINNNSEKSVNNRILIDYLKGDRETLKFI